MLKNYLKKIKPFVLPEKITLFKYTIGNILIDRAHKGLVSTYVIFQDLSNKGVDITKSKNGCSIIRYEVNNSEKKFLVKRKSSDANVFKQIILDEEYKRVIEIFSERKLSLGNFIDAGANVGFTTIYLKNA